MMQRTLSVTMAAAMAVLLAVVLAAALAFGPVAPARATSLPLPAVLPVAQVAEEEHDHGYEADTDPWSNVAAPLLMIGAGLLYVGFVGWQMRHRRGAARPR